MRKLSRFLTAALFIAAVTPVLASDRVIYNGIDLWRTAGEGRTFTDFSLNPIPAGFFCDESEAFMGRIDFQGVPVATSVSGALGNADTIIQRLDDAIFNEKGIAVTRIQVRALNFESIAPVKTACGLFTVKVSLDGAQPITQMQIIRESKEGGRFVAPISVDVKMSFTSVDRPARELLEVRQSLRFPPAKNQRWEGVPASKPSFSGFLLVDTDGDSRPDTSLPGTSNFGVGLTRTSAAHEFVVHDDIGHQHSVY